MNLDKSPLYKRNSHAIYVMSKRGKRMIRIFKGTITKLERTGTIGFFMDTKESNTIIDWLIKLHITTKDAFELIALGERIQKEFPKNEVLFKPGLNDSVNPDFDINMYNKLGKDKYEKYLYLAQEI